MYYYNVQARGNSSTSAQPDAATCPPISGIAKRSIRLNQRRSTDIRKTHQAALTIHPRRQIMTAAVSYHEVTNPKAAVQAGWTSVLCAVTDEAMATEGRKSA